MDAMQHQRRLFVFYLVPDFTLLALTSAIESLRLANTVLGYDAYAWRVASADGNRVRSSCGLSIEPDCSIAAERSALSTLSRPGMAIVAAGRNVEKHMDRSAEAWLRECGRRGVKIGSLCTGAYLLARAGLLDGKRCTMHWENLPGFVERFSNVTVTTRIYEIDDNIYTCAGGTAAVDMMLHLIGQDFGDRIVASVSEQALMDRVRCSSDRQRLPLSARLGSSHPAVLRVVEEMEAHLAEPLALSELAAHAGLSRRQIERLFRQEMKRSPARYYLEVRLERARLLLTQTALPIVDIAIACGFVASSHFSKCYREMYGCAPHETRAQNDVRRAEPSTAPSRAPSRPSRLPSEPVAA